MELELKTRNMDLVRAMGAQAGLDERRRPIVRVMAMWGASKPLSAPVLLTTQGAVIGEAIADEAVRELQAIVRGEICKALRLDRLRAYAASEGADVGVVAVALDAIVQGDEPELPEPDENSQLRIIAP